MKQRTIFAYALLPVLGLAFLGTGIASAHGMPWNASPDEIAARQQTMFAEQAKLLGITIPEFTAQWALGKTMREIAAEKGISDADLHARIQSAKKEELRTQLNALVAKNIITQAQADQRFTFMENRIAKDKDKMGRGGRHMGFWF